MYFQNEMQNLYAQTYDSKLQLVEKHRIEILAIFLTFSVQRFKEHFGRFCYCKIYLQV
jgi:hypothetical protein